MFTFEYSRLPIKKKLDSSMIIDFTEIHPANKGGLHQDQFEFFACDFLEAIGFKILSQPDRGADGKKDMIVSEKRGGIGGETQIKWLVSCKHYAHSNKAVSDVDESDILDRVATHKCDGFIGFFSTIPSSSLTNKLSGLSDKIEYQIYDPSKIERLILSHPESKRLLLTYFPESFDKHQHKLFEEKESNEPENKILSKDEILQLCKTAIIQLEIEQLKESYLNAEWDSKDGVLAKLYKYSDHADTYVITQIVSLLQYAANQTRMKMPERAISEIHSLVLTFFPSPYGITKREREEIGKRYVYIGFSIAYDALIYLNDFLIAEWGLSIFKFLYREAKRDKLDELTKEVLKNYEHLEETLNRPERTDLQNAKDLVKIFKDDLNNSDLSFPILPEHLYKLTLKT